jgi:hypothetical protein
MPSIIDHYSSGFSAVAAVASRDTPAFADAEVLTLALLQGCLGVAKYSGS